MKHVYSLDDLQLDRHAVVTIGVFDGVHKGHQHLIRRLVTEARSAGRLAVALTFHPHPDVVFGRASGRYYLTTPDQRAAELGKLGIDYVVTQTFDDAFRQIRAAAYVDTLLERLKLASLWVGEDFAMGYKREGNIDFLRAQSSDKGFTLEVLDLVESADDRISSTSIREALAAGEVEAARGWLGRGYRVAGEVIHGEKRGHKIGFPTANIDVWREQIIPANGVYACRVRLGDERFMAVTNIGVRPTFDGQSVTVEAHLLDFDRDIYGEHLEVSFETRLRGEQRFDGIDALIAQINRDVEAGRSYLVQQVAGGN